MAKPSIIFILFALLIVFCCGNFAVGLLKIFCQSYQMVHYEKANEDYSSEWFRSIELAHVESHALY